MSYQGARKGQAVRVVTNVDATTAVGHGTIQIPDSSRDKKGPTLHGHGMPIRQAKAPAVSVSGAVRDAILVESLTVPVLVMRRRVEGFPFMEAVAITIGEGHRLPVIRELKHFLVTVPTRLASNVVLTALHPKATRFRTCSPTKPSACCAVRSRAGPRIESADVEDSTATVPYAGFSPHSRNDTTKKATGCEDVRVGRKEDLTSPTILSDVEKGEGVWPCFAAVPLTAWEDGRSRVVRRSRHVILTRRGQQGVGANGSFPGPTLCTESSATVVIRHVSGVFHSATAITTNIEGAQDSPIIVILGPSFVSVTIVHTFSCNRTRCVRM